jgi:hypothetical protein
VRKAACQEKCEKNAEKSVTDGHGVQTSHHFNPVELTGKHIYSAFESD